ncbi:MAG TPA: hypothetical protein VNU48_11690, partial [Burkholderiaceae bacterium]|nr:hypothetical protein [Burkholderiaceae bacterium]
MRPSADDLRQILAAGVQAPSAENRHAIVFLMREQDVELTATDSASWAALPHRAMLALLACGAVLENMALRSAQMGYAMQADILPEPSQPTLIARLDWQRAGARDALSDQIEARHTNRRLFRSTRAAPEILDRLLQACRAVAGADLLWLDARETRSLALHAIRIAETERFKRARLHEEIFSAVRFEAGWSGPTAEGLAPATLEVEAPMRPLFAALRHWPTMRRATWFGVPLALGFRAGYLPCASAPHLGLIVGRDGARGNLDAGRAMQRIWLAATAEGLSLQPMAAATALARQVPGDGWVAPATRQLPAGALERLTGASR